MCKELSQDGAQEWFRSLLIDLMKIEVKVRNPVIDRDLANAFDGFDDSRAQYRLAATSWKVVSARRLDKDTVELKAMGGASGITTF